MTDINASDDYTHFAEYRIGRYLKKTDHYGLHYSWKTGKGRSDHYY